MNIEFDYSEIRKSINPHFYPLLKCKNRYLVLKGGGGSGKSHFVAQKFLIRTMLAIESRTKLRPLLVRKTQPSLRESVFQLMTDYIDLWGLTSLVDINKTEMKMSFEGGTIIRCHGLDERNKIKSIEGITDVWIEECIPEIEEDDFIFLDMYMRGKSKTYQQMVLGFNPISSLHWIHKKFFEKKMPDSYVDESTYKDNRFLSDRSCKVYEDLINQDENYYRIYALGEWGQLQHTVYSNYEYTDEWPEQYDERIYGLDFGYNNPTAMVEIRFKDKVPYERELLYRSKMTNTDLISWLASAGTDNDFIYCDCAEPNRIEEIGAAGYNVIPADKSVKDGIDYCKRQRPKVLRSSSNWKKEIVSYVYKKDKDGNIIDEPVKHLDHLMDARRYAYYTHSKRTDPGFFILK
ncbi:MAG: PBSX family phage terminase large subunit [Gammaproteobacteria bacterium]|nr:PBSX family phage terminase large subunit [Gammaproteobacteria bacterium]